MYTFEESLKEAKRRGFIMYQTKKGIFDINHFEEGEGSKKALLDGNKIFVNNSYYALLLTEKDAEEMEDQF